MARTIGIGIIGMGWMGQAHSRAYNLVRDRFPECDLHPELVICADIAEDRAQESRQRFGFKRHTTDWHDVIADPEVDVVNIAAPNYLHLEMALAAAAAGKHVFCEKPAGRSLEETLAMADAVERAGKLHWVGFNYRWAPVVQHARQLIADGRLGTITHYRSRFFAGYASDPLTVCSWRFQQDLAGYGTLGDLMPHVLDMAHFLNGPIANLVGNAHTFYQQRPQIQAGTGTHFTVGDDGPLEDVTNEDYVGVIVRFANGAQGTLEACRVISGPQCQFAFEVNGTEGALKWDFERMNEIELYLPEYRGNARIMSGPQHPNHVHFNPGSGIGLGYDDLKTIEAHQFLSSIAEGRQGEPGLREAIAAARVQQAIARSWETGSWQEVEPAPLYEHA